MMRPYMNGSDLVHGCSTRYVLDFNDLELEEVRTHPAAFQYIYDRVMPERLVNREARTSVKWWRFRRSGEKLRLAVEGLPRYAATTRTAKHRVFQFLAPEVLAESKIVVIASDDALHLGILSSRAHVAWATAAGGWLGVGNDPTYNHVDCFEKFPFPDATDAQKARIRSLAEELDVHRKRQQVQHPKLTLTNMYNVLEKLRSGAALSVAEKITHEQGLVSVLRQLHDDLDAAVFDAYGWPATLADEEILARLVALNAERAAEEARGLVRWLRPEYQAPQEAGAVQLVAEALAGEAEEGEGTPPKALHAWPQGLADQAAAVRAALAALGGPVTSDELAAAFDAAPFARVSEWLAALAALGQARVGEDGRYVTA
jgi:hypothetical protein